jgi:hypothetical protein
MKKRTSKILNFFAFNLLFFALYLNFIHKDQNIHSAIQASQAVVVSAKSAQTTPDASTVKERDNLQKSNKGSLVTY